MHRDRDDLVELRVAGGRRNGSALWHAVPRGAQHRRALCGLMPVEWATRPADVERPSCDRCDRFLRVLELIAAAAPAAYDPKGTGSTKSRSLIARQIRSLADRSLIRPGPGEADWILAIAALVLLWPAQAWALPHPTAGGAFWAIFGVATMVVGLGIAIWILWLDRSPVAPPAPELPPIPELPAQLPPIPELPAQLHCGSSGSTVDPFTNCPVIPSDRDLYEAVAARWQGRSLRSICESLWPRLRWLPLTEGGEALAEGERDWPSEPRRATCARWVADRLALMVARGLLRQGPADRAEVDRLAAIVYVAAERSVDPPTAAVLGTAAALLLLLLAGPAHAAPPLHPDCRIDPTQLSDTQRLNCAASAYRRGCELHKEQGTAGPPRDFACAQARALEAEGFGGNPVDPPRRLDVLDVIDILGLRGPLIWLSLAVAGGVSAVEAARLIGRWRRRRKGGRSR